MAATKDITSLVERLEAFEERLDIRLESLYASYYVDNDGLGCLKLQGVLHPLTGTQLRCDVCLVVDIYDSESRLVGAQRLWFDSETFFGFESFDFMMNTHDIKELSLVRVYPKQIK